MRTNVKALLAFVALLGAAAGSASGGEQATTCRGPAGRTIAEDRSTIVYAYRGDLLACRRGEGPVVLSATADDQYWFPRPALDLRGSLVAFAYGTFDQGTLIRTEDPGDYLGRRHRVLRVGSGAKAFFRVGSVVASTRASVAWIQCPVLRNAGENAVRSPYPNCVRPGGSVNSVYAAAAGGQPRLIARSRGIDPRSLRLLDDRISWRQNGRKRSARLG